MVAEIAPDTGALADGSKSEQADKGTSATPVSDGTGDAHESGGAGQSAHEGQSSDARLVGKLEAEVAQLTREIRRMKKLFSNHSHEQMADEQPTPSAEQSKQDPTGATQDAQTPELGEKPPVQTASHRDEKQRARRGYFTRIHRGKGRTSD